MVAAAHVAAPLVWRKHVGLDRRLAAANAVRGALNMQRRRTARALIARRRRPLYAAAESKLLRAALTQYRRVTWVHASPDDATWRARIKTDTVTALSIIDALVAAEKTAT